ncbi:hypothetical protein LB506_009163 [Fusarium annulatum]|nr:hypothetical protein LB506_009163 [Fusarium annulatum]
MEAAGFQDIQEWNFKCLLNRWPKDPALKEIGGFAQYFSTQDSEGILTLMADMAGWSTEYSAFLSPNSAVRFAT